MVTHMKTTIDIADALFAEAKKVAARENTTIRALVEEGLRETLKRRSDPGVIKIQPVTFRGRGLHSDVGEGGWDRLRDLVYEGRGGRGPGETNE